MSGSPKYSTARPSRRERERLERERAEAYARELEARKARERAEQARLEAERARREEAERQRQAALKAESERKAAEELARRRAAAEQRLEPLQARLAGLQADAVTMTWAKSEVEAQVQVLEQARQALVREHFDAVEATCVATGAELEALENRVQARQLVEEQRGHIVQGMLTVLERQGFQVGAPALSRPGDFDSEVVFRAVRPDNRSIRIAVPPEGNVTYEVDGWSKRQEQGRDGRTVSSCDDAEQRLRAIGDQLADEFGIEVGEIMWDGKDPDRIQKDANSLPGGGPRIANTRGGGGPQ